VPQHAPAAVRPEVGTAPHREHTGHTRRDRRAGQLRGGGEGRPEDGQGTVQPPRRERRAREQDEVVGVGGDEQAIGSEGEGAGGRQEEEHGEADEADERAEDTGHAGVVEHGGRGALGGVRPGWRFETWRRQRIV
ncbi:hypothetical protein THAOC_34021, partial [Thalassiosira oceanica]